VVFSTLHTNDAPSAVTRLVDIGVEAFLLAATLEAVIAQRLVRRICRQCKQDYEPDDVVLRELSLTRAEVAGKRFAFGKGCEECNFTGYRGRMGLYEIMPLSERLKQLLLERASTNQLREVAAEEGLRSLRDAGLAAVVDGQTSVEDVVRETLLS
jgi:type IV pilus assembly protein PilB